MLNRSYSKSTRDALVHVLDELKDYGLEVEVNFVTLEILVVDLNEKWRRVCRFCFGWSAGDATLRTRLKLRSATC